MPTPSDREANPASSTTSSKNSKKNPKQLEILGDGTQTKSYLYITDCINAIETTLQTAEDQVEIYNVGSEDQITVTQIAKIITEEMGLPDVEFTCTVGVDGGRG